jgi:hypothetical protein
MNKKLLEVFAAKAIEMIEEIRREDPDFNPGVWSPNRHEIFERWESYLDSVGCRMVRTPEGMLPVKGPNVVHVHDPMFPLDNKEWHIQMPRELAERILALGLP